MRKFNQNDCFDTLQDTALRTYIKNLYSCNGDKVSKSLIDKVRLFVYRYQKKNSKEENDMAIGIILLSNYKKINNNVISETVHNCLKLFNEYNNNMNPDKKYEKIFFQLNAVNKVYEEIQRSGIEW